MGCQRAILLWLCKERERYKERGKRERERERYKEMGKRERYKERGKREIGRAHV